MRSAAALQPVTRQIATGVVINATGVVCNFDLPNDLAEFRIIAQVTAFGGTAPTLDLVLQDSPDGTQTWFYTGNKMTQMTGVDQRQLSISRERTAGQAAAESSGTVPAAGAAAAAVNGPLARKCRMWAVLGGSAGPTFTVNIFIIGNVPVAQ